MYIIFNYDKNQYINIIAQLSYFYINNIIIVKNIDIILQNIDYFLFWYYHEYRIYDQNKIAAHLSDCCDFIPHNLTTDKKIAARTRSGLDMNRQFI